MPTGTSETGNALDTSPAGSAEVAFLEPTDGAVVPEVVTVHAHAGDGLPLKRFFLLVDGAVRNGTSGHDLSTDWRTCTSGEGGHVLTAMAEDFTGERTTASISVTVDWTPVVSIDPLPDTVDFHQDVPFQVVNAPSITSITLLIDGAPTGATARPGGPACITPTSCTCEPWSASVVFTSAAEGVHDVGVEVVSVDGDIAVDSTQATVYWDHDGDGYDGAEWGGDDCDDHDASIFPGAFERCDGFDDDCDGVDDSPWDVDGDGYCSATQWPAEGTDCDDGDPDVNPGVRETCGNGVDDDCDGADPTCTLSGDLNLGDATTRFIGEASHDKAGSAVSGAGDVNADGYDDILIGAPESDLGGLFTGAAYLVYGPTRGDFSLGDADARFVGMEGDQVGRSVSEAGDVDGDGYDDLLIGAYKSDHSGLDCGAAYLVAGPVTGDYSLAEAEARLLGEEHAGWTGASVDGARDVDGDGYDDLLIGAPTSDIGGSWSGAAYMVYGPVSGDRDLADADARMIGEAAGDWAGYAVTFAGDVNGDGHEDVLVGAYSSSLVGRASGTAYLLHGPLTGDCDLSEADARLIGEVEEAQAGWAVSNAGDMNEDGYDDILVGAPGDSEATSAGTAYLVFGPVSGDLDLADADSRLVGGSRGDDVGEALSGTGDVDGDGRVDLLVGASGAGGAFLLLGPKSGDLTLADADARFLEEVYGDHAGCAVSGAGDVDADGRADLLIGARFADLAGSASGGAYLVLGRGW